ncbi:MAG TPA: phosphoribosyltransferase family protein [Thermoanaerobaculia bacterium]|nr:phosphoribosyltransferase family protein [Thermoanaerobaculia bacterium]
MKKKRVKKAFSDKQIARRIAKLGKSVRKDAGKAEIFLLGVLKGASFFLADLMRAIPGDVSYGYINVIREMADTEIASAMEIDYLHWSDIAGKHVYLLKDVVSTGVIETYLLQQLRQKNPAELKLIALVDRPELRTVELEVDYRAFEADHRGVFVGYGLELVGQYANLPYIGRV